jgi:hypothetical protein
MDEPKLTTPIILVLVAALLLCIAWYDKGRLPDWLIAFLIVSGLVFLVWGFFLTVNYMTFTYALRLEDIQTATASADVALANAVSRLTPEQVKVMQSNRLTVKMLAGNYGPVYSVILNTHDVPLGFVAEQIDACEGNNFRPSSFYNHLERDWAKDWEEWCVAQGLAARQTENPPAPARWLQGGRQVALGMLDIAEKDIPAMIDAYRQDLESQP